MEKKMISAAILGLSIGMKNRALADTLYGPNHTPIAQGIVTISDDKRHFTFTECNQTQSKKYAVGGPYTFALGQNCTKGMTLHNTCKGKNGCMPAKLPDEKAAEPKATVPPKLKAVAKP
jgi:hypothetical protein